MKLHSKLHHDSIYELFFIGFIQNSKISCWTSSRMAWTVFASALLLLLPLRLPGLLIRFFVCLLQSLAWRLAATYLLQSGTAWRTAGTRRRRVPATLKNTESAGSSNWGISKINSDILLFNKSYCTVSP